MDPSNKSLHSELVRLRRTLPKGAVFVFNLSGAGLFLKLVRVPLPGQGVGSRFLAEVLAAADAAGVPVRLKADPTDEPGDPDTLALVRWYSRFGFVPRRATDDGVWMDRPPPPSAVPAGRLLEASCSARATRPSRDDVDAWLERARRAEGASPSWRRPPCRP